MVFGNLGMLNIIIGIFCESAQEIIEDDKEQQALLAANETSVQLDTLKEGLEE
jgi:hypothetical protein